MVTVAMLIAALSVAPTTAHLTRWGTLFDLRANRIDGGGMLAAGDEHTTAVAHALPGGRYALPATVDEYESIGVRLGRRWLVLDDRPDTVIGGWAVYRVVWPRRERLAAERERQAAEPPAPLDAQGRAEAFVAVEGTGKWGRCDRHPAYRLPLRRWALPSIVERIGHGKIRVRHHGDRNVMLDPTPERRAGAWVVYREVGVNVVPTEWEQHGGRWAPAVAGE